MQLVDIHARGMRIAAARTRGGGGARTCDHVEKARCIVDLSVSQSMSENPKAEDLPKAGSSRSQSASSHAHVIDWPRPWGSVAERGADQR